MSHYRGRPDRLAIVGDVVRVRDDHDYQLPDMRIMRLSDCAERAFLVVHTSGRPDGWISIEDIDPVGYKPRSIGWENPQAWEIQL